MFLSPAFFVQLKREFAALIYSPIAWIIFVCIFLLLAFPFFSAVEAVKMGYHSVPLLIMVFMSFLFWLILPVVIPLISMRSFSEEYKSGTIEPLMTAPVTDLDIVCAKFLAIVGVLMISFSAPFVYYALFQYATLNQMPTEWSSVGLSFLILLLITMFYTSVSIFASSMTKNQIVAGLVGFTITTALFFFGMLSYIMPESIYKTALLYIFSYEHFRSYGQGIFDSRPLVFYITGTLLFLALTQSVMASRRLKK